MQQHPLFLLAAEILSTALVIGFTPSSSPLRFIFLVLLSLCVCTAIPTCTDHIPRNPWAAFVAGYLATLLLQYISTAVLGRWSFDNQGPRPLNAASAESKSGNLYKLPRSLRATFWDRLKFGFQVTTSFRYIGTPYQVRNVPHFSASDPSYIPSRSKFLSRKAIIFLVSFSVLDLISLSADPQLDFSPETIPLFTRVGHITSQQLLTRLITTLGYGIAVCSFQQLVHSIVALIDVGFGFSKVESWRPLFGSPGEAYTLRRFWGVFWHQNNRRMVGDLADYITYATLQHKYLNHFLNFFISGFLHALIDVACGLPWLESGAIQFFCTQFLGIILEDFAWKTYNHLIPFDSPEYQNNEREKMESSKEINGSLNNSTRNSSLQTRPSAANLISRHQRQIRPALWLRIIGVVWVISFLTWSMPVWLYPSMYRELGDPAKGNSILPFSVFGPLLRLL